MLTIRKKHFELFRAEALFDFEERMLEHLKQFSPRHFRVLYEPQIRTVIQEGIQRAERHRLTSERSIRYYVDVMVMLGGGFDADPLLPWAARILAEKSSELIRVDRLYSSAWAHVERVPEDYRGIEGSHDQDHFIAELHRILGESAAPSTTPKRADFREYASSHLAALFPTKHLHAGDAGVLELIDRGVAGAANCGLISERGVLTFIVMSFVLGAGFAYDPLLPWAAEILNDARISDESARIDRLFSGAMGCLQQWWDQA